MNTKHNPTAILSHLLLMIAAFLKWFLDQNTTIDVNGVEMKVSDIVAKLRTWAGVYQEAEDAEKVWKEKLGVRTPIEEDVQAFIHAVHVGLSSKLGFKSQKLLDFGFQPAKDRKTLTSLQNVERAEKSKATREKRHTMGKRQKRAIKGDVKPNNGGAANGGPSNS